MFATLLGWLPRPPLPDGATPGELLRAALDAQLDAGLEPVIDGEPWTAADAPPLAERWTSTAALTGRAVKAAVAGPYTANLGRDDADLLAAADVLNEELRALAGVGCPLIEVHEPAATAIGEDRAARRRFAESQRRLLRGLDGVHCSLAIVGGNANLAGIETLLAAPYASLALDLVRGPDNWYVAAAAPSSVGIVCGAMTADDRGDETIEILLYALGYAASTGGRGFERVGIASAGSLGGVPWPVAERRMRRLGEAVRLAAASPDERAAVVDPRAVSSRAAALGRAGIRRGRRP